MLPTLRRTLVLRCSRSAVALFVAVATALAATAQFAPALASVAATDTGTVSYIVSFGEGTSTTAQSDAITAAGGFDDAAVPELRMHMVSVPVDGEAAVLAALRSDSSVL